MSGGVAVKRQKITQTYMGEKWLLIVGEGTDTQILDGVERTWTKPDGQSGSYRARCVADKIIIDMTLTKPLQAKTRAELTKTANGYSYTSNGREESFVKRPDLRFYVQEEQGGEYGAPAG